MRQVLQLEETPEPDDGERMKAFLEGKTAVPFKRVRTPAQAKPLQQQQQQPTAPAQQPSQQARQAPPSGRQREPQSAAPVGGRASKAEQPTQKPPSPPRPEPEPGPQPAQPPQPLTASLRYKRLRAATTEQQTQQQQQLQPAEQQRRAERPQPQTTPAEQEQPPPQRVEPEPAVAEEALRRPQPRTRQQLRQELLQKRQQVLRERQEQYRRLTEQQLRNPDVPVVGPRRPRQQQQQPPAPSQEQATEEAPAKPPPNNPFLRPPADTREPLPEPVKVPHQVKVARQLKEFEDEEKTRSIKMLKQTPPDAKKPLFGEWEDMPFEDAEDELKKGPLKKLGPQLKPLPPKVLERLTKDLERTDIEQDLIDSRAVDNSKEYDLGTIEDLELRMRFYDCWRRRKDLGDLLRRDRAFRPATYDDVGLLWTLVCLLADAHDAMAEHYFARLLTRLPQRARDALPDDRFAEMVALMVSGRGPTFDRGYRSLQLQLALSLGRTPRMYNLMLDVALRLGQPAINWPMHERMKKELVRPDSNTYLLLMKTAAVLEQPERIAPLLDEMHVSGLAIPQQAYHMAVRAHLLSQDYKGAADRLLEAHEKHTEFPAVAAQSLLEPLLASGVRHVPAEVQELALSLGMGPPGATAAGSGAVSKREQALSSDQVVRLAHLLKTLDD